MTWKVGETYSVQKKITKEMVAFYAKVSGDNNPIHLNKDAATEAGFPREIVHGMLTMGMSTKLFLPFVEKGYSVMAHSMKFIAPLFVDGNLLLIGKIERTNNEIVCLEISGYSSEKLVIIGSAELGKVS